MKVPEADGVPLIVMVPAAQWADTPAGRPFTPVTPSFDIPVAPVVLIVMAVRIVLIQRVGVDEGAPAVLFAVTVMVPMAFTAPQPPVMRML